MQCLTYSINYFQQPTQKSWFAYADQTPLLPAPYKRLIDDINITNETNKTTELY